MKDFNEMSENVLKRRDAYVLERRIQMKKLTVMISCFCMCTIIGASLWLGGAFEAKPAPDSTPDIDLDYTYKPGSEFAPAEHYDYVIDEGRFSAYVGGKVISEDKLGAKLADVTLTAGWKNADGTEWLSEEKLRGEVYTIDGIENDVAVALRFIDQGEAVTTTHYYVIMNPNADLSVVEDYVIRTATPDLIEDIIPE